MKIVMFYQSLVSDWNHGNAHFLRGVTRELLALGNDVEVYESYNNWCLTQLVNHHQEKSIVGFHHYYPELISHFYSPEDFDPAQILSKADLVIVHEFNDPLLIRRINEYRRDHDHFQLLFHDTHHRCVSDPDAISHFDLHLVDGVLAYGSTIKEKYLQYQWAEQVWVWHEAADETIFHPRESAKEGDMVWIGNWGDDERTDQIRTFLIEPVRELGLKATFYGVQYPNEARRMLADAGIRYGGYLPNYLVPDVYSRYSFTVHVPRKFYAYELPGIPTIRPFEAMACGIPLISTPWNDEDTLFEPDVDFKLVSTQHEMKQQMRTLVENPKYAQALAEHARETILNRHTCRHRVRELLNIYATLKKSNVENVTSR